MCHMSGVRCHMTGVMCKVSGVFFCFVDKAVGLVCEGSVMGLLSTGPTPPSFL